jgi:hypothetical protein
MDLIRKWWWIVLVGILLGLVITHFIGGKVTIGEKVNTGNSGTSNQETQVAVGGKAVTVTKQVSAEVVSWDSNKGELIFTTDKGQITNKIIVDPDQVSILVPPAQHNTNAVLPISKKDLNWQTAFCQQDGLTVGYDSSGTVRLLFNTGYRMCGFKEE